MSDPINEPGEAPDRQPTARQVRAGRVRVGRRAATSRRWATRTLIISAALVFGTFGAAALIPAREATEGAAHPPRITTLTDVTVVCPPADLPQQTTFVASGLAASGEAGFVALGGVGAAEKALAIGASPTVVSVGAAGGRLSARDDAAPGLAAGALGAQPLAGVGCQNPEPDHWFSGLGAGPRHGTRILLVNPDPGPAIADLTVYDSLGRVDAPDLRGVAVPGGEMVVLDLAALIPSRADLGVHVTTVRGRLGVFASDAVDDLGRGEARREWVSPTSRPRSVSVIPGLFATGGNQTLTLLNPGDSQAVVTLTFLTRSSAFTPAEGAQVEVPAESVAEIPLTAALSASAARGALGIEVDSSQPLVAALRAVTPVDLAWSTTAEPIGGGLSDAGAVFLGAGSVSGQDPPKAETKAQRKADRKGRTPTGLKARLVLAATPVAGSRTTPAPASATVRAYSADGELIVEKTVSVAVGLATQVTLPPTTAWVWVSSAADGAAAGLSGAVRMEAGGGLVVLPLAQVATQQRVPHVGAGSDLLAP